MTVCSDTSTTQTQGMSAVPGSGPTRFAYAAGSSLAKNSPTLVSAPEDSQLSGVDTDTSGTVGTSPASATNAVASRSSLFIASRSPSPSCINLRFTQDRQSIGLRGSPIKLIMFPDDSNTTQDSLSSKKSSPRTNRPRTLSNTASVARCAQSNGSAARERDRPKATPSLHSILTLLSVFPSAAARPSLKVYAKNRPLYCNAGPAYIDFELWKNLEDDGTTKDN